MKNNDMKLLLIVTIINILLIFCLFLGFHSLKVNPQYKTLSFNYQESSLMICDDRMNQIKEPINKTGKNTSLQLCLFAYGVNGKTPVNYPLDKVDFKIGSPELKINRVSRFYLINGTKFKLKELTSKSNSKRNIYPHNKTIDGIRLKETDKIVTVYLRKDKLDSLREKGF